MIRAIITYTGCALAFLGCLLVGLVLFAHGQAADCAAHQRQVIHLDGYTITIERTEDR